MYIFCLFIYLFIYFPRQGELGPGDVVDSYAVVSTVLGMPAPFTARRLTDNIKEFYRLTKE